MTAQVIHKWIIGGICHGISVQIYTVPVKYVTCGSINRATLYGSATSSNYVVDLFNYKHYLYYAYLLLYTRVKMSGLSVLTRAIFSFGFDSWIYITFVFVFRSFHPSISATSTFFLFFRSKSAPSCSLMHFDTSTLACLGAGSAVCIKGWCSSPLLVGSNKD